MHTQNKCDYLLIMQGSVVYHCESVTVLELFSLNASFCLDLSVTQRNMYSSKISLCFRRLENMVVNLCLPHFYATVHCNKVRYISWNSHVTNFLRLIFLFNMYDAFFFFVENCCYSR